MNPSRLQRIQKKKSHLARTITLLSLLAAFIFVFFFAYRIYRFYSRIKQSSNNVFATKSPEERNTYNLLILGYGGGNHDGAYLTDTIMVIHADIKKNKAVVISIPRDTWVNVPMKNKKEIYQTKINALYEMGLFPKEFPGVDPTYTNNDPTGLIKYATLQIVGFPIDAYVGIDFSGFTKAIDVLGGVDVTVDRTFTDPAYPIEGKEKDLCGKDDQFNQIAKFLTPGFDPAERDKLFQDKPEIAAFFKSITDDPQTAFPCRYEELHFTAGPTHMDGATALEFARSRHSLQDGGDFNRAKRQQKIIEALKQKVLSIGGLTKTIPLMDTMEKYIKTDIPQEDLQKLLPEITDLSQYNIINLVIAEPQYVKSSYSADGQYMLIPKLGEGNWNEVKTDIKNIMLGITPTPTPLPITPTIKSKK